MSSRTFIFRPPTVVPPSGHYPRDKGSKYEFPPSSNGRRDPQMMGSHQKKDIIIAEGF